MSSHHSLTVENAPVSRGKMKGRLYFCTFLIGSTGAACRSHMQVFSLQSHWSWEPRVCNSVSHNSVKCNGWSKWWGGRVDRLPSGLSHFLSLSLSLSIPLSLCQLAFNGRPKGYCTVAISSLEVPTISEPLLFMRAVSVWAECWCGSPGVRGQLCTFESGQPALLLLDPFPNTEHILKGAPYSLRESFMHSISQSIKLRPICCSD